MSIRSTSIPNQLYHFYSFLRHNQLTNLARCQSSGLPSLVQHYLQHRSRRLGGAEIHYATCWAASMLSQGKGGARNWRSGAKGIATLISQLPIPPSSFHTMAPEHALTSQAPFEATLIVFPTLQYVHRNWMKGLFKINRITSARKSYTKSPFRCSAATFKLNYCNTRNDHLQH